MPISPPSSFGVPSISPSILARLDDDEEGPLDNAFGTALRAGLQLYRDKQRRKFQREQAKIAARRAREKERLQSRLSREESIAEQLASGELERAQPGEDPLRLPGETVVMRDATEIRPEFGFATDEEGNLEFGLQMRGEEEQFDVPPSGPEGAPTPISEAATEGTRFEDQTLVESSEMRAFELQDQFPDRDTEEIEAMLEDMTAEERARFMSRDPSVLADAIQASPHLTQEMKDRFQSELGAATREGGYLSRTEAQNIRERFETQEEIRSRLAQQYAFQERNEEPPATLQNRYADLKQTYRDKYRLSVPGGDRRRLKPEEAELLTAWHMRGTEMSDFGPWGWENLSPEQKKQAHGIAKRAFNIAVEDGPWANSRTFLSDVGSPGGSQAQNTTALWLNSDEVKARLPDEMVERIRGPQGSITRASIQDFLTSETPGSRIVAGARYLSREYNSAADPLLRRDLETGLRPPFPITQSLQLLDQIEGGQRWDPRGQDLPFVDNSKFGEGGGVGMSPPDSGDAAAGQDQTGNLPTGVESQAELNAMADSVEGLTPDEARRALGHYPADAIEAAIDTAGLEEGMEPMETLPGASP